MESLLKVLLLLVSLQCVSQSVLRYQSFHKDVFREIKNHRKIAADLIKLSVDGAAKNQSYNRLAEFVDTFGFRIAGSKNLENSIDYVIQKLKEDGLENVHGETVMVPHWVRGYESAKMIEPRIHPLSMLGLGGSIGTPPEGITAEALVVRSFDELKKRSSEAKGKIIVFNEDWAGAYYKTVPYRDGAVQASEVGGVASLIRSITPFSINSPHTGIQDYNATVKKIPTACITIEDAEMMARMAARGDKIVIHLKMDAKTNPDVESRNLVAEIKGRTNPEEVVVVSGHIDSWDVGQGAMDDGCGAFISWQALSLVHQLGLRPKRTLRAIFWTAEEQGSIGAYKYFNDHKSDLSNYDLVMESDTGTLSPSGLRFSGNEAATEIVRAVVDLLDPIGATNLTTRVDVSDIVYWQNALVPTGSLFVDASKYFYFHHSNGDTMTVQNSHDMDVASAIFAVVAYVVADLEDMLPRKPSNTTDIRLSD
ncbi:carboxypeptidase Q-like [Gigantopelta aegis]|uniref:carboxypeptidase Q-like n=1 Tax=Gigantopelta aegis TaxID=1735272 RepID=UPI001B88C4E6|nr:carboxypeptidase Q-like [Gigantopelta aegis]